VGDKGLVAALDELAPRGQEEAEPSTRALRQRIQESELRCAQLEERVAELESENHVLQESPPDRDGDHLVPTSLVAKLVEEYDAGRALLEQKVAMELQRRQAATRRAEAAEREVIALQQSLVAANATSADASARLTAERLRVEQLERRCEEVDTGRAEQELVAQRAIGRVEVLHSELHGKAEAMAKLHNTLADRTQQCAALRADCDRLRSEPLRMEMVEMSQQLQQAVQAREDMSEVWEQLLEGNARLRREKSMLETAISETPTRAGGAPYLERGSNDNGNGSGGGGVGGSPASWQHGSNYSLNAGSPGPSASQHPANAAAAASPTLLSAAGGSGGGGGSVPLGDLRGHGMVDRGYGLSRGGGGGGGRGGGGGSGWSNGNGNVGSADESDVDPAGYRPDDMNG
jgi:hypothetical protein